jgi:hypothetical protein
VTATGTGLSYKWQKDNVDISPAATSSSYTTPATTMADNASTFRCIVHNSAGDATSSAATLHVNRNLPVITTDPASQTVNEGQIAIFSVTATGTGLSYKWQKNDIDISPAATLSSYTTPPTTMADNASNFRCIVHNSAGDATSSAATLSVNMVPPIITAQTSDTAVTEGTTASFNVSVSGSGTLSYQWQRSDNSGFSWLDISSANSSTYTILAATALTDNGAQFHCIVRNEAGPVTSNAASLTVN